MSEDIKKKLKDLLGQKGLMSGAEWAERVANKEVRVEPPASRPEPPSPPAEDNAPGDIREKLRGLLAQRGVVTGSQWAAEHDALEERRASGELDVDHLIPGDAIGDPGESFYLVRHDYALDARQGDVALGDALDASPAHVALSACDTELAGFDPRTTVFMDTETTGLAGGTGTMAFLVGVGYFTDDGFRLDQCFMRDYDDETAMLRYLDQVFRDHDSIVTYNGKSFDVPLLRTRFISNRIPCRLDGVPHFDLVHAARRFWKRRLGDCSLGSVERQILGVYRHGDIPSAEIPQIWFDYLRSRDATLIERVLYHHEMDILSLVALTALLSRCLDAPDGEGFEHREDRLSLVRLHFRQRRYADVVSHGTKFIETETETALRRECLEMLAYAHKRTQDWQSMEDAWTTLLDEDPKHLDARLELAKHYEHRKRHLIEAARVCEEAVQFLETRCNLGRHTPTDAMALTSFQRRLERIRRKISKPFGAEGEFED